MYVSNVQFSGFHFIICSLKLCNKVMLFRLSGTSSQTLDPNKIIVNRTLELSLENVLIPWLYLLLLLLIIVEEIPLANLLDKKLQAPSMNRNGPIFFKWS